MSVLLSPEREKIVMQRYKEGVAPKNIAHEVKMSLRDVYKIIKKQIRKNKNDMTTELKAIQLYRLKKFPVEVTLRLRITPEEATEAFIKYKDLIYLGKFGEAYARIKGKITEVLIICDAMQRKEVTIGDIIRGFHLADELPEMESMHSAFTRTINRFTEDLNNIISEKEQANNQLQELYSLIQQAEVKLSSINSQKQNAEAELARINQNFNYPNQNNNTNSNYGYSNNPYYYPSIIWGQM